jgi:hypothetical protein
MGDRHDRVRACAGCGAEISVAYYHHDRQGLRPAKPVRLGPLPEHSVFVCATERHGDAHPMQACLDKARRKVPVCPGCGGRIEQGTIAGFRMLCEHCEHVLVTRREAESTARAQGMQWVVVDLDDLAQGDYRHTREVAEGAGRLADLLGVALRAPGAPAAGEFDPERDRCARIAVRDPRPGPYPSDPPRLRHGERDRLAYLDADQATALQKAVRLLADLFAAQHRASSAMGRDLLGSLVRGEVTVEDYNQEAMEQAQVVLPKTGGR